LVICIDCDNVMNDLQAAVIKVFNKRYGTAYILDDFKKYNISQCLNKEDAMKFVSIYSEPGIYDSVAPLLNAQNALYKLQRAGHEIYVVSHSEPSIFEEKSNWIKYYFPTIDDAHIISMQHKWLFKCDVMVEDNLDNLLGGHHYERVLFNWPWNRNVRDEVYGIHRVSNWDIALDVINKINKRWSDVAV